jgi:hypothetical protein
MFWSQEKSQQEKNQFSRLQEQLRDELRLRLRVAADFATLGAYELSGPDDHESPAATPRRVVREAPPKRVLLFAKVAAPCPASHGVEQRCTASDPVARRKAARRERRGGTARAPEQPCLSAGVRTPVV